MSSEKKKIKVKKKVKVFLKATSNGGLIQTDKNSEGRNESIVFAQRAAPEEWIKVEDRS